MTQADIETLGPAGPDNRDITTRQAAVVGGTAINGSVTDDRAAGASEPDFPPESLLLPKDAEHDWFDRNAVYERKDSTRGNSNPNSMSGSNSQRSSAKSKASIIGLPRTQKAAFADSKWRTCKAANAGLFPKRENTTVTEAEPGSPKVSCMGRVRSMSGRRRANPPGTEGTTAEKSGIGGGERRSGFCAKVMRVFCFNNGSRKPFRSGSGKVVEGPEEEEEPPRRSAIWEQKEFPAGGETAGDPPGLGGMVRFRSGRRSGS
ncbi:RING/U-box superfamily protein [Striga asiatica]|uniref:RING/U-box superfamily protein n=1 Tax=Striga asiatica TaxID=4170 RepID=A0A5A7PMD7_STRAF|nr:RING/U-box superfamily protein [Striga asiatica]